jgi:hypothetical protein
VSSVKLLSTKKRDPAEDIIKQLPVELRDAITELVNLRVLDQVQKAMEKFAAEFQKKLPSTLRQSSNLRMKAATPGRPSARKKSMN